LTIGEAGAATSATPALRRLLERETELATLSEMAAEAAAGRPGLLVIEGPAGIGKTRLLAEGRKLASDAGFRVLAARGGELEQELAFGIVRQLFEAAVIDRDDEPFRGAAAAARELFYPHPTQTGSALPTDASFAILHALYWVTVNLAADGPLILAVDDLHWSDEPSLRYFSYLARRLEGLTVEVICALRPFERHAQAALLGDITRDPLAVSLRPGLLTAAATAELVAERLGEVPDELFASACSTATGGNPLLVGELLKTLHAEGVRPDAAHVSVVRQLGPRAVSRSVLVRLARLSSQAARLARAAAVVGEGAELAMVAELSGVAADDAAAAAAELVAAEILSDQPTVSFVHPLVGGAVYEDIPAHIRALAHERAARLLCDRRAAPGPIAAHLLLAPPRGAEWVCDVLEQAAHTSLRAGSSASAVAYLTRSLNEPPPERRRAQALLSLGQAEALLSAPAAIEHLSDGCDLIDHPLDRGSATLLLARTVLFTGRPVEAVALARQAIAELGTEAPDLACALESVELMAPLFGACEAVPLERLERYRELPAHAGAGAKMLATVAARHWAYGGGPADDCARLALGALSGGELIAADNVFLSVTAILIIVLADREESVEAWRALMHDAHVRGSLLAKLAISLWRGHAMRRRGELADAEASLRSALDELAMWAPESMQGRVHCAGFLSAVLRDRGDLAGARAALQAVERPDDASDGARYWLDSLAELLIAEERFAEALAVVEDSRRRFAFIPHPIDTPSRSHQAVALDHLGRHEEALVLATEELELARRWSAPGTVARALRIIGTLRRSDGLEDLHQAVEVAARSPARLEHAKALAALGSALRAARRPTEARDPLRRALELADTLGAQALAAHARHELHAAGGRPRVTALQGPDALTPSERRVTERAAAGHTNRAIAEALFVTTKTVELHLRNAYRKLGASSRRELADKLAE
jgi:DNA-binding NarL/FixJ family response regulator